MDEVFADQIVIAGAGLVRGENAAGIVGYFVAQDRGMIRANEVNSLSAVCGFIGFERRDAGTGSTGQRSVVIGDFVVDHRNVCRIGKQDAFEVGIADLESGDDHVGNAGSGCRAHAVDPDSVGESCGIDDCLVIRDGDEGERFVDDHRFAIDSRPDLNDIAG